MENLQKNKSNFTMPITALVLGGLCVVSDLHPLTAILAGGMAAAMIVNLGRRNSIRSADILGFLFAFMMILLNDLKWSSMVMAPSLASGLIWLRLPHHKMDSDDRIYLPSLGIVLGIGILFIVRADILKFKQDFLILSGLTGVADLLNELILEGADQVSGESRDEYLKMTQDFMIHFPYYYIGFQIAAFSLIFNFTLRIQRNLDIIVSHFLLFKIKERYVFLLIFGMGIEIFRYFLDRKELLYFSRSIFVFLGVTYFLAGLAVIGFLILIQRLRSNSLFSHVFTFVLIFIIIIKPIICSAIGLLDIWFDFRRLKTIPGGGLNS
jgi:hypothetical protein